MFNSYVTSCHAVLRLVARNAVKASGGLLPGCQDTGTAIVMGKRGMSCFTAGDDEQQLSHGVYDAYTKRNLRYSQMAPVTMFAEKNTKPFVLNFCLLIIVYIYYIYSKERDRGLYKRADRCNLPAQIDILATSESKYECLGRSEGILFPRMRSERFLFSSGGREVPDAVCPCDWRGAGRAGGVVCRCSIVI